MIFDRLKLGAVVCAGATAAALACGSDSPTTPSRSAAPSQVQIGVAGNGSTMLAPGESRQLFATAMNASGQSTDVTSLATWQSSNPVLATVSAGGLLAAAAEGDVEVSATYQSVRGTLRALVRRPVCNLTVTPPSASYDAFGGTASVQVTTSVADCTWTARSDAPWFPFTYDQGRGNGSFSYTLPSNSTPDARSGAIVITSSSGEASHAISQARPLGCSYVVRPESAVFTAAGGSGSFDVITSPADCSWFTRTTLSEFGVFVSSGFNGIGARRVTYTVDAHTRSVDVDGFIEIHGLSGLNPPGRHRVTIQKR